MILGTVLSPSDHTLPAADPAQTPSWSMRPPPPKQKTWLSTHHPTLEQSPSLASSLASRPNTPQNCPYSFIDSNPIPLQCLKSLTSVLLKRTQNISMLSQYNCKRLHFPRGLGNPGYLFSLVLDATCHNSVLSQDRHI